MVSNSSWVTIEGPVLSLSNSQTVTVSQTTATSSANQFLIGVSEKYERPFSRKCESLKRFGNNFILII